MTLVKVQRPRRNRALSTFSRDFDDMFRGFFDESMFQNQRSLWRPAMNAQDLEKEFVLSYSLPGFEKEDIHVSMQDRTLTVKAAREEKKEEEASKYLYREIGRGSFERSIELPENVKSDKIAAEYKSGILTLTIPKTEVALPKEIEVKVK